jgi:hypothetical protein
MANDAYSHFVESMAVGYEAWHDGTGYDVPALAMMTPEEREMVEAILTAHLADSGDWRDVEALAALGTLGSMAAVNSAKKHRNAEVRNFALKTLADAAPHEAAELEDDIVRAVERGALDLAQCHPTPRVKRALLDCARLADPVTRVNAAALLMYLCGSTSEPFDWSQRPFFLRFGTDDMAELRAAWTELRERTGI